MLFSIVPGQPGIVAYKYGLDAGKLHIPPSEVGKLLIPPSIAGKYHSLENIFKRKKTVFSLILSISLSIFFSLSLLILIPHIIMAKQE